MLRPTLSFRACCAIAIAIGAACGGSATQAGPSYSQPFDAGDGVPNGPSGLPCDVDKILADNCRKCHSAPPQYGAPMPLMTWDNLQAAAPSSESKKLFEMVADRIANDAKPMPPPPNARLSEADRKKITDWIAAGTPRSSEDCRNPSPTVEGLTCTPNVSLAPSEPWEMPQNTGDEYVCWGVDLAKEEATHITAFAPKIDNKTITHHIVLYESEKAFPTKPAPCSSGSALSWRMVLGWAPGVKPLQLPADVGFPISSDPSKPTHYVAQMHYSNVQKLAGQTDKSSIDLCTAPPRKYEADVMAFGSQDFRIPAGGPYAIDCSLTVPSALGGLHFFAAMPHMHKLGVAMSTKLTPKAGGADADMGTMSTFSFDNQAWLPIDVVSKSGDTVHTKCSWVNDRGETVPFGEKTANEMCYSFTMYYPRIKSDLWSWAAPASGSPLGATCTEVP